MIRSKLPATPLLLGAIVLALLSSSVSAFVMTGPHLLRLMAENLKTPKTLLTEQQITVYPADGSGEVAELTSRSQYLFPDRFRSDTRLAGGERTLLTVGSRALTVIDERIAATSESPIDHYKDVLLFRNRELLTARMAEIGVDVSVTSLGRFDGQIGYVLGARYPDEREPQLWLDKKTFRPFRLVLGPVEGQGTTEFRYGSWRQTKGIWYPHQVDVYENGRQVMRIDVRTVRVNVSVDKALFDIDAMAIRYPAIAPETGPGIDADDDLGRVQQSIKDFKSLYE